MGEYRHVFGKWDMSLSPSLFLTIDSLTLTLRGQVSCKHITASKYMFVSPVLYVHEQTGVDGLKVHVGSYYYFGPFV